MGFPFLVFRWIKDYTKLYKLSLQAPKLSVDSLDRMDMSKLLIKKTKK